MENQNNFEKESAFQNLKNKVKEKWHKLVDDESPSKDERADTSIRQAESIDSRMARSFASSDAQVFTDISTPEPVARDFAEDRETRPREEVDETTAPAAPITPRRREDIPKTTKP